VRTVPLILLRHASAGSRSGWNGADLARPLDVLGAADADALAWVLRCFGVGRVISSAAERCVATVRPFAALTGATLEIEPLFTMGALAAPDEIVVSGTVKDLVVGSGIEFADRGEHDLKGVPGSWKMFAVEG